MQKRTTNIDFKAFGDVFYQLPAQADPFTSSIITLYSKTFDRAFYSSSHCYITNLEGISMLYVSKDGQMFESFIMHRVVQIAPNTYFNIVPISSTSKIDMRYKEEDLKQRMLKKPITLNPIVPHLQINELLLAAYHVRKENYHGKGHIDQFYELIYIDQGKIHLLVDEHEYTLSEYDTIVIYPGQKHVIYTDENISASYLVIDFQMNDSFEHPLIDHIFHTDKRIYKILSRFMASLETNTLFDDELAIIYLKEVLLLLYQDQSVQNNVKNPMSRHFENTLLNEIVVYIHNNIYAPLSVEELCDQFSISRSTIQGLFRAYLDTTPKQYISDLKLNEAKKMIMEHKYTISMISSHLGYTSIHYFSRKFKERFGQSPTEFAKKEAYHS